MSKVASAVAKLIGLTLLLLAGGATLALYLLWSLVMWIFS